MIEIVPFYIVVGVLLVLYVNRINKRNGFVGMGAGFCMGLLVYYIIVPLMLVLFKSYYSVQPDWKYSYIQIFFYGKHGNDSAIFLSLGLVVLSFISFYFGYRVKFRLFHIDKPAIISGANSSRWSMQSDSNLRKGIFQIGCFLTIGGLLCLAVYIRAFGGIARAFQLADAVREQSTSYEMFGVSGIAPYMLMLSSIALVGMIVLFLLCVSPKYSSHITKYYIAFAFSLIPAGIYLRLNNGKSAILRVALVFAFLILKKYYKHPWLIIMVCALFASPILSVLDTVMAGNPISTVNMDIRGFVTYFYYPELAVVNVGDIARIYGYQYFKYFILDIIDFLPGISVDASYLPTSEYLHGADWIYSGGVPTDVITYGFLQLGVCGLIIYMLLCGILCRNVDNRIKKIESAHYKDVISAFIATNIFTIIAAADIAPILKYNIPFVLVIVIGSMIQKRKIVRFRLKLK